MELAIRPYVSGDDEALMNVCLRTGAAGNDATGLLVDAPDLVSEIYLLPYLRFEPTLASVVAPAVGPPLGYVVAAADTTLFEAQADQQWWPALRAKYPPGRFSERSLEAAFAHSLHHRHPVPADLLARYPSHLHIDLLPEAQGQGWGRRLLVRLFAQLAEAGSPGVHLKVSTANEGGIAFYRATGFDEHSRDAHSITFTHPL